MKPRLKHLFIAALFIAVVILSACSGNKTTSARKYNDSIYSQNHIVQIAATEPDRALALIDTLEINGKYPTFFLNYLRCAVCNNSMQIRSAIHYGTLAISDPQFKKEKPLPYMDLLYMMAQAEWLHDNYAGSMKILKEALMMADEHNFGYAQSSCRYLLGNIQIELGEKEEGIKTLTKAKEIAIALLDTMPNFTLLDITMISDISIIETLCEDKKYSEAEKYLPELLKSVERGKKIKGINETFLDGRMWSAYLWHFFVYGHLGKTEEAEKYRILSEATQAAKEPYNREQYCSYYIAKKNYKEALANIDITRKFYLENRDTLCQDYLDAVLSREFEVYKETGNYAMATRIADKIINCKDSIDKKTKKEDAAELAKLYETQEKEKQLAEQKAKLSKQKNILISVAVLLLLSAIFIVIVLRFSRRVNRRNKTIVATINQMMHKEDEMKLMHLNDNGKTENVDPEDIRLKQSLEMLKEDKTIDNIVTECGYRDANDFGKKFYDHFGIHAEEYRKWSKKISEQEKAGDEEAKQMKDSFIKNMSHEIRTPLNQIFGFVQLLTDPNIQLSDEEKRQYNEIIGEQTNYMTRMLNKFLEISEYESRKEPLPQETVSIADLFNEVNSVVPRPTDGVELTFSNNSGRTVVEANHEGLSRIIQCLVGNAVKFTSSGSISVECSTNAEGKTIFTVTDTGKGIPEGDEERIFDRFYKVDEFVPGAGLGLSLVREIARCMEATVVLDCSYAAKGSRFVVTLRA